MKRFAGMALIAGALALPDPHMAAAQSYPDRPVRIIVSDDEDWLGHNAVIRFAPDGTIVVVLSNSGEVDGTGWSTRVNRAIRGVMGSAR